MQHSPCRLSCTHILQPSWSWLLVKKYPTLISLQFQKKFTLKLEIGFLIYFKLGYSDINWPCIGYMVILLCLTKYLHKDENRSQLYSTNPFEIIELTEFENTLELMLCNNNTVCRHFRWNLVPNWLYLALHIRFHQTSNVFITK